MVHNRSRIGGKLLVPVAIIGVVAMTAYASYDRHAAVDYALRYWDKVCSDGYYFEASTGPTVLGAQAALPTESEGFDCAHFVSCCIGNEPNEPAGSLDVPSRTLSYGEPGAQRLMDWLLGYGAARANDITALVPGDIVAYDADHNGWIEHVALYMGDGLVTAHSLSRYSEWNPDPESSFVFLHLPGAYEPRRAQAALGTLSWLLLVMSVIRLTASLFLRLH